MKTFTVIAPTRADLAGGTLDLWPLYCLTGRALTINVALDLFVSAHFEVSDSPGFRVDMSVQNGESVSFSEPPKLEETERLSPLLRFPAMIVAHYLSQKATLPDRNIRIQLSTEVPLGGGLGGSSAICVALARGMARIFSDYTSQGWQWPMLDWVRDIEASYLKTPTGTQDYLASLFGGLNCFDYRVGSIERVPYASGVFEEVSKRLLVLFSGEVHQSGLSNWELFKGALSGNESIIQGIKEIADVSLDLDGELRAGNLNWKYIGKCLSEEWNVRRNLFRVETSRLEEIITFLKQKHIYGAKVCGAAQGGSLIALVDPQYKDEISQKCNQHGIKVLPTQGAAQGVTVG